MRWMVRESKLDENQLSILQKCGSTSRQNEWIQGFAGSGKTVLLVHMVQRILAENPETTICVVVYTHALKDLIGTGFEEKFDKKVVIMTYHAFLYQNREYDLVVVDEVQDIPHSKLISIHQLAKRVVVGGDIDQSIYEDCSTTNEIKSALEPRLHQLVVLYRLTQKLRDIVTAILPSSQILEAQLGRMQDVQVTLAKGASDRQEIEWVWDKCRRYAELGDPAVVILPKHEIIQKFISEICRIEKKPPPSYMRSGRNKNPDYEIINEQLMDVEIPLRFLGNGKGDLLESDRRPVTYIMTYHSAKGLDFQTVFLPHLTEDLRFWRDNKDIERRLFFVGMTRSRKNLFLSYSSHKPHEYVQRIPQALLHQVSCEESVGTDDENNYLF